VIYHFPTIESTNTEAVHLAGQGASQGTVIHADCQTGGKGRGGRNFFSPEGGLYFSLILRPNIPLKDLSLVTLAVGVGICKCLMATTNRNIQLKWPNDLYLEGRKLGGILTESGPFSENSVPEYLVVGVGINVQTNPDHFPSSLRSRAISLYHYNTTDAAIAPLLNGLVDAMLSSVKKLESNKDGLLADWQSLDYLQGKVLKYESPEGVVLATGKGLAPDGRYIIQDEKSQEHLILAGDLNPMCLKV